LVSAFFALGGKQHARWRVGRDRRLQASRDRLDELPAPLQEIGFDQNIDQQLPSTRLRNEAGATVHLGEYFGKGPSCWCSPTAARCCAMVINGLSARSA
jgi:hypothetical protein